MTAIILAGGKASRMKGQDKAFLKIDNEPLISTQLRLLKKLFKEIIIVTNLPEKYAVIRGVNPVRNTKFSNGENIISNGVKVISDIIPHQGPLGGIYSGLAASNSFYNFVVACDMPFINEFLVRYMIANRGDYDVMISKIGRRFHPLFGIYSKNCIPAIEEMLKRHRLKVTSIFSKIKSRFLSRQEIERFDKKMLSLLNINTPDELRRAKKWSED